MLEWQPGLGERVSGFSSRSVGFDRCIDEETLADSKPVLDSQRNTGDRMS